MGWGSMFLNILRIPAPPPPGGDSQINMTGMIVEIVGKHP